MKKTLSIALLLCCFAAAFSSCKNDDGPDNPSALALALIGVQDEEASYSFTYDKSGHISAATIRDDDFGTINYAFAYTDEAITATATSGSQSVTETYRLQNGRITSWENSQGDKFTCTYTTDGHIASWTGTSDGDTESCKYTWKGSDLAEVAYSEDGAPSDVLKILYSKDTDYGRIIAFYLGGEVLSLNPILVFQNFYGPMPEHMAAMISGGDGVFSYSYHYDSKNGWLNSVTQSSADYSSDIRFTWRKK